MKLLFEIEVERKSGQFRSKDVVAEVLEMELEGIELDVDGSEYEVLQAIYLPHKPSREAAS